MIMGGLILAWLGVALLVVGGLLGFIPGSPFFLAGRHSGPTVLLAAAGMVFLILGLWRLRRGMLDLRRRMAAGEPPPSGPSGWRDVTPPEPPSKTLPPL